MDRSARNVVIGVLGFVSVALVAAVVMLKKAENDRLTAEQVRLDEAQTLVASAPGDALNLYYETRGQGFPANNQAAWSHIHASALYEAERWPELAEIYNRNPAVIVADEALSIAVYKYLGASGRQVAAKTVYDRWRHRETDTLGWLEAKAAAYVYADDLSGARGVIKAAELDADLEAARAVLLARLTSQSRERSSLIAEATSLAPNSADVREARGLYLESQGQVRAALYEYRRALAADADNPQRAHALAEYLVRNRQSRAALRVWQSWSAKDQTAHIRASLWERLVGPRADSISLPPKTDLELDLLVRALATQTSHFYDASAIAGLESTTEAHWITLLDQINKGQFNEALALLDSFPVSAQVLNPVIYRGFYQVLSHRVNGTAISPVSSPVEVNQEDTPYIARQLETLVMGESEADANVVLLLESPEIFTAIALAGGWTEAALNLSVPASSSPRWLQLQWAKALMTNQTAEQALNYVDTLKPWDETLEVLAAELFLKQDAIESAKTLLEKHLATESLAGVRAAGIYARLLADEGQFNDALRVILANPAFRQTVPAHELAARIYLKAGDTEKAKQVLSRVTKQSVFAREFLAIDAYRTGDFDTAREHLLVLVAKQPERKDVRDSLMQVEMAVAQQEKLDG